MRVAYEGDARSILIPTLALSRNYDYNEEEIRQWAKYTRQSYSCWCAKGPGGGLWKHRALIALTVEIIMWTVCPHLDNYVGMGIGSTIYCSTWKTRQWLLRVNSTLNAKHFYEAMHGLHQRQLRKVVTYGGWSLLVLMQGPLFDKDLHAHVAITKTCAV